MSETYRARPGKVTLTANATKSLLLLNPVTDRGRITAFGVSMDTPGNIVAFEWYRVVTIGSAAGTSGTVVQSDPGSATPTWTFLHTLTTEPTTVSVLEDYEIPTGAGPIVIQWPLGREPVVAGGGARYGLRYVTPASVTPGCRAWVEWEE